MHVTTEQIAHAVGVIAACVFSIHSSWQSYRANSHVKEVKKKFEGMACYFPECGHTCETKLLPSPEVR